MSKHGHSRSPSWRQGENGCAGLYGPGRLPKLRGGDHGPVVRARKARYKPLRLSGRPFGASGFCCCKGTFCGSNSLPAGLIRRTVRRW